jgi:hypothetical protein
MTDEKVMAGARALAATHAPSTRWATWSEDARGRFVLQSQAVLEAAFGGALPAGHDVEALAFVDKTLDNIADDDPVMASWRNEEIVRMLEDIRSLLVTGKVTP